MENRRALIVILLAALLATLWLVHPWLDAVVVAAVVAILAWPMHAGICRRFGQRRGLGTALTLLALVMGIFLPVALLGLVVGREVVILANEVASTVELGSWDSLVNKVLRAAPLESLVQAAGGRTLLGEQIEASVREGVLTLARTVTTNVPGLLSVTATAVVKVVVFLLALTTFLHRGPDLLGFIRKVSPLSTKHTDRLLGVFALFARNVVLAGLAAGALQGVVAFVGFWLAGVDRALLFGALTAVFAYVPLLGSTLVWVPVSLLQAAAGNSGAALFIGVWGLGLTGTVDNFVRPVIVRGKSDVPLLMVFLGAFGGLGAFGLVGLLVGPVLVAVLLALLQIYAEDLPEPPPLAE